MNDLITDTTASTLTLYGGVRLLTADTGDDMTTPDYYDLYLKLRSEYPSLSKFSEAMGAYPTKAEWSRDDRGEEPRDCIKDALRKASGKLETIEIIGQRVPKGTPVFFIGCGDEAGAVLLLGDITAYTGLEDVEGCTDTTDAPTVESTPPARAYRRAYRPRLRDDQKVAIAEIGMTAEELIDWAIEMKRREV